MAIKKRNLALIGTTLLATNYNRGGISSERRNRYLHIDCHWMMGLPAAHAIPANPLPFRETQPDGSPTPFLRWMGDDSYSYLTDERGYKVVVDVDGWFVYAEMEDDVVGEQSANERRRLSKPSNHRLGQIDPSVHGYPLGIVDVPPPHERFHASSALDLDRVAASPPPPPPSVRHRSLVKTHGTFHNLVLLLRFSNHKNRDVPPQSDYDTLYNTLEPTEHKKSVAPTGSIRQVFLQNSYGAFTLESTVYKWITLSKSEEYYANGNHGFTKLKEGIEEALDVLEKDPGFEFADFDLDGDGMIDGFGVLHSGYGAEFGGDDCYGAKNENRIWSHKGGMDWTSKKERIAVNRYYVSSGLRGKCGEDIVRMGVICHEIGHYLGLPDLYDATFEGVGIGAFDMMSQSWGYSGSGLLPPLLSAWSKLQVGWATPILIEHDGTYSIEASSTSPIVYKITEGFPEGEYLLLENRQPQGFDEEILHGGIAIWHIDDKLNSQDDRGYPSQPQWPYNGKHYQVALLSADGKYDFEKGTNQGDADDLWHADSKKKELKPGSSQYPNTDTYQDGSVTETKIRIFGFSPSGDVMTFSVEGFEKGVDKTSAPTSSPTGVPTLAPTHAPTNDPTNVTTPGPSREPTRLPTGGPTHVPTHLPSSVPSEVPSNGPSTSPTESTSPTSAPPTQNPTLNPATNTTGSPVTEIDQCASLCLEPIPSISCPKMPHDFQSCLNADMGELCDADGECGTDNFLNNCAGYDVYRVIPCTMTNWMDPVDISGNSGTQVLPNFDNTTNVTTEIPTTAPSTSPTKSPTNRPVLTIVGSNSIVNADSETPLSNNKSNECKYYPGWNIGLPYCLHDCNQPTYMKNNPIFEFDSVESCCNLHYRKSEAACAFQTSAADVEVSTVFTFLPSVSGHIWNDANGNDLREGNESGMHGVLIDLFTCGDDIWVKGTRTSTDGSFHFIDLEPGHYYLKMVPPAGYQISASSSLHSDFTPYSGETICQEFRGDDADKEFIGSVVPDVKTELVSAPLDADIEPEEDELEEEIQVPIQMMSNLGIHSKARPQRPTPSSASTHSEKFATTTETATTSATRASTSKSTEREPSSRTINSLHSKSFLRGFSNFESTDSTAVTIQALEDITIKSKPGVYSVQGELKVGCEPEWCDDVLIKFDATSLKGTDYKSAKSAILRLYALNASPVGGTVHVTSTDTWEDSRVTWDNAPSASDHLGEIGSIHPNQWVDVDVTYGLLKSTNGVLSLRIKSDTTNRTWRAKYSSLESMPSHVPELRVSF
mmetsp:Transcript_9698/g.19100  ORF Transcript_9698/g.19100 Transcript_9698/m.19100 type:complete len:1276 (-) Transcript_9698:108-3935(-)